MVVAGSGSVPGGDNYDVTTRQIRLGSGLDRRKGTWWRKPI
jgi:hypothetical protein